MGRGDLSLSGVPLSRPTDNKIFILFNLQTALRKAAPSENYLRSRCGSFGDCRLGACAEQQDPLKGVGHWLRSVPGPSGQRPHFFEIAAAEPEKYLSGSDVRRRGPREEWTEIAEGPGARHV